MRVIRARAAPEQYERRALQSILSVFATNKKGVLQKIRVSGRRKGKARIRQILNAHNILTVNV